MKSLVVRHIANSDPTRFQVVRLSDGKSSDPVAVPSPVGLPVEGRPNSDLLRELPWYLETFLDYPFEPETVHAERIQRALASWGEQAFDALFGQRGTGRFFDAATLAGYGDLHLQIASDEPGILAWPWEALRDPELGFLAHTCQIERRLQNVRDPAALPANLPKDRVNILLVTARPYQQDVRYRSISRPLLERIAQQKLPAHVDLLRPPTFDQLRRVLRERRGHYHILHFDGHGAYRDGLPAANVTHQLRGSEGRLIFEKEDGSPDPVTAERLSALLHEVAVPVVVLNACQSAMLDDRAEDAFASVAAALVRSGMRSVVAMAYSLYVSAAQRFLPAFYERLFGEGNVAQAVRAGRQEMVARPGRSCPRGEFPLDDWLVPVLYQQEPLDFSFTQQARQTFAARVSRLPAARSQRGAKNQSVYGAWFIRNFRRHKRFRTVSPLFSSAAAI